MSNTSPTILKAEKITDELWVVCAVSEREAQLPYPRRLGPPSAFRAERIPFRPSERWGIWRRRVCPLPQPPFHFQVSGPPQSADERMCPQSVGRPRRFVQGQGSHERRVVQHLAYCPSPPTNLLGAESAWPSEQGSADIDCLGSSFKSPGCSASFITHLSILAISRFDVDKVYKLLTFALRFDVGRLYRLSCHASQGPIKSIPDTIRSWVLSVASGRRWIDGKPQPRETLGQPRCADRPQQWRHCEQR